MKEVQTQAIHAGRPDPRIGRAIVTPVFQSSTYEYHGEGYHDVVYMRLNNTPNHQILAKRIAVLEGSEASIVTASGMAAISSALFSLLSAGDHLLVQDCLYGGTHGLVNNELSRLGISRRRTRYMHIRANSHSSGITNNRFPDRSRGKIFAIHGGFLQNSSQYSLQYNLSSTVQ